MYNYFSQKISAYISRHHLLTGGGRYLVALSGGADSVALLRVLLALGYRVEAVHCNFKLRGEESDRDEQFCRTLCDHLQVPFHIVHFDTRSYAVLHHESIELAARNLRYAYFQQLAKDLGAQGVCVAHHQDDAIETLLMNIVRGTGMQGLKGIQPQNGNILRPLLAVSRKDIEDYLTELHQDFVTDSTNLTDGATRNVYRHQVIPLLEKINPAVREHLVDLMDTAVQSTKIVDSHLNSFLSRRAGIILYLDYPEDREGGGTQAKQSSAAVPQQNAIIALKDLFEYISPEYLFFEVVRPYGFSGKAARGIFTAIEDAHSERKDLTGRSWKSAGYELLIDRDRILIEPLEPLPSKSWKIPETGTYHLGEEFVIKIKETPETTVSKDPKVITVDADKVRFPLTLRTITEGDRFIPFGMKNTKLVSDFLTDQKVNLFDRRRQLILVDAAATPVWLVARRIDARVAVSPQTRRVLRITVGT